MTKFEFLGDLSRLIADLPREEVEQAMEYYEDYFADAGPEKEQEIIRDFISPAYIAEQLREASLQRQKAAEQSSIQEAEKQAAAARAAAASQKPPVYSRKLAAQAQKNASMATSTGFVTQTPTVKTKSQVMPEASVPSPSPSPAPSPTPTLTPAQAQVRPQTANRHTSASQTTSIPQNQPSTAVPVPPAMQAQTPTPAQAAASIVTPTPAAPNTSAPQKTTNNSSMRNSIFQDDTEEDKKKAEEELARRNKTKVDIKSINSTTSKVDKKRSREDLKRNAAMEKANNAERYSSSKKMVIGIVLLITCPIWLTLIGIILGVFVLGAGAVVGCIAAGIGCLIASVCSIALTLLALLSARIATGVFTLGCILFLFAAGCGLCFAGYKLATRVLPGGYFSVKVLLNGIKAKIARLALK